MIEILLAELSHRSLVGGRWVKREELPIFRVDGGQFGLFHRRTVALSLDVLVEEADRCFAHELVIIVAASEDLHKNILLLTEQIPGILHLFVGLPHRSRRKFAVVLRTHDIHGFWRLDPDNIGSIPNLRRARNVVTKTAIVGRGLHASHVNHRDGGFVAVVGGKGVQGSESAPACAGNTDSTHVRIGAGCHVVKGTHGIPHVVAGSVGSALDEGEVVVVSFVPSFDQRVAFEAPTGSIDRDGDVTLGCLERGAELDSIFVLLMGPVSVDVDDDRQSSICGVGNIDMAGDKEARSAFEHDFFDAVAGALNRAGEARVERSFLGHRIETERSHEFVFALYSHLLEGSDARGGWALGKLDDLVADEVRGDVCALSVENVIV